MRIWDQSTGSVQMNDVGGPISEHARRVVEDGTEVVVHGLPAPADYVTSAQSIRNGAAPPDALTTIDVIGRRTCITSRCAKPSRPPGRPSATATTHT